MSQFRTKFAENIFNQKYKHDNCETWEQLAQTLVHDICGARNRKGSYDYALLGKDDQKELAQIITDFKFIPAGRFLYYAGRERKFTNNCFLLKAEEDTREDWAELSKKSELCLAVGGGIGINYDIYRASGSILKGTGGYACLTGDTVVYKDRKKSTEQNSITIETLYKLQLRRPDLFLSQTAPIKIRSLDEKNNCFYRNKLLGVFYNGIAPVYEVTTKKGYKIKATINHRFLTQNNQYKQLSELHVNDLIGVNGVEYNQCSICGNPCVGKSYCIACWNKEQIKQDALPTTARQRKQCREYYKKQCEHCGETNKRIEIHHIDRNVYNNAHENLLNLCCKCHQQEHFVDLYGKPYSFKYLAFDSITKIEYVEDAPVYDLQMAAPDHNFVANGFVSHNSGPLNKAFMINEIGRQIMQGGSRRCLPAYTPVSFPDGSTKRIDEIKVGDVVATRFGPKRVVNVFNQGRQPLLNIVTEYGSVVSSYGHRWLTTTPASYKEFSVPAEDLGLECKLYYYPVTRYIESEIPAHILSISTIKDDYTYDLEIEDAHEFIAAGFVSHNSAIYGSLNHRHPDIKKFLVAKNWYEMPIAGTTETLGSIKEKDFNFHAPLDMTNISVNYDTAWLKNYWDTNELDEIFLQNCEQALKTAEPGFSFNFFDKETEVLRNACTELTSSDDSDLCNLGSINLAVIETIDELEKVIELAIKFLICGTLRGDLPYEKVARVREKNRRLGLGLMGIHEWLLKRGYRYEVPEELHRWLTVYRDVSNYVSDTFADSLNISRPVGKRAIAPTGSIGILASTTTGIEPLFAVAYKRRYLKGTRWHYEYVIDGTAQHVINELGTDPDSIETALQLATDYERRISVQANIQEYVDHAISSTINLPEWGSDANNSDTIRPFAETLAKYAHRLRGFTCYPASCRGGQPLVPVAYKDAVGRTGTVHEEVVDICSITGRGGVCGA